MVHLSEVDMHGEHVPLSYMAMKTFSLLAGMLPQSCPIILESPLAERDIDAEIAWVEHFLPPSDISFAQAAS